MWSAALLGGALLLAAPLVVWYWPGEAPPAPPAPAEKGEEDDIKRLLAVANPGYVGIETCAECHARRVEDFKAGRHYLACRTAEGVASPGFLPGRGRYEAAPGIHFEMARSGDDCLIDCVRQTPEGQRRDSFKVGLVYGSGNNRDEMYFAWEDNRLYNLPVGWLYPQGRWGSAVDHMSPAPTPPSCLECHNTWIAHVPGAPNEYRREDMFLGVTCERCHGPGKEHADYHRESPKSEARAILHPGSLSRERRMDLCAQCHGNTRLLDRPFSYRPGKPLADYYHTARAKFREDDTTTNQVQYLGESKCFQKSKMTCITCHHPHKQKPAREGCLKCHTDESHPCTDRDREKAVRDDCVGCHMPQHVWMNSHYYTTADDRYLPVATRSEHRIAKYPEAKLAVELAWLRTQKDAKSRARAARHEGKLVAHWLGVAERRLGAGRLKAAIGAYREVLRVGPNPRASRGLKGAIKRQAERDGLALKAEQARGPEEAIELWKKAVELNPRDARAHAQLGTLYALTGQPGEAAPHLREVAEHGPNNSSGLARLAWLAQGQGRHEEAVSLCEKAEKAEPGLAFVHTIWGKALLKLKRWEEAEGHFRKALRPNPADGEANRGLSMALRHQGKAEEAIRFGRRAAHFTPDSAEPLLTLAEAYSAAGRSSEASKAFERALAVAEKNEPRLVPAIRERMEQLP